MKLTFYSSVDISITSITNQLPVPYTKIVLSVYTRRKDGDNRTKSAFVCGIDYVIGNTIEHFMSWQHLASVKKTYVECKIHKANFSSTYILAYTLEKQLRDLIQHYNVGHARLQCNEVHCATQVGHHILVRQNSTHIDLDFICSGELGAITQYAPLKQILKLQKR